MQHIDEAALETDIQQRYDYLANFIGFDADDVKLIQASAPHIGPHIAEMVDRTYEKLLAFDSTARHFLPQQHGSDVEPAENLAELSKDHPQIQFRKDHLNRYFMSLIGRAYDAKMVVYLDMVGKIHTTNAGSNEIAVPLVQMNALMGLISDIIIQTLAASPLDDSTTLKTIRAWQKLLWIQNDFVNRHYCESTGRKED